MFGVILLFSLIGYFNKKPVLVEGRLRYKENAVWALLPMIYIIFWTGMRNSFVDTASYISSYNSIPTGGFSAIEVYMQDIEDDRGFYLFSAVFKNFISDNYHWWLFFIAAVSGLCVFHAIRKHSDNMGFSLYLFMSMGLVVNLLNGIRQFLVVSILFALSDWLLDKRKRWLYLVVLILLSTFHSSALFALPFFVIAAFSKPWDKRMVAFIVVMCIGVIYADEFMDIMTDTVASDYADTLGQSGGSGIIRTVVAFIPPIIAFWKRKVIASYNDHYINICINFSVVSALIYLMSSFTDGILVGRMPIYFNIFNIILLPWLLNNCFVKQEKQLIMAICIGCYIIYFYYQSCIAGSWYYSSDFTGLIT